MRLSACLQIIACVSATYMQRREPLAWCMSCLASTACVQDGLRHLKQLFSAETPPEPDLPSPHDMRVEAAAAAAGASATLGGVPFSPTGDPDARMRSTGPPSRGTASGGGGGGGERLSSIKRKGLHRLLDQC